MLQLINKEGRSYIREIGTRKLFKYHYGSEDYARETLFRIQEDWISNQEVRKRDLEANFVDKIEDVIPSQH